MAEQVNQRIQKMVNELEQMRRTNLFDDEEIKEISRKRKEFEYRIQRRIKEKEDFVQYITYELTLLENISLRRKQLHLREKKNDIEYAIAKRLNSVFKQFISRYQNDVEIYFEYIRFCKSIGFQQSISGIIAQMLQVHGDKPKTWQLASKWESKEQNSLENAQSFLLKGIHRHPNSAILYLELFEIELIILTSNLEADEEKEKQLKKIDVIWRNAVKNINDMSYYFKVYDLCVKYQIKESIIDDIKQEIWAKREECADVWSFVAAKEIEGHHWDEIDVYVDEENKYPKKLNNVIGIYEEALHLFPDQKLCTKFIHDLLGVSEDVCTAREKISVVKKAWMYGHENGLLANNMYTFGIEFFKLDDMSHEELKKLLDSGTVMYPQVRCLWEEMITFNKSDEKQILNIVQKASKTLKSDDILYLWNVAMDYIKSATMFKNLYKKFQTCDSTTLLAIKPKLLQKMYTHNGLIAAREMYEELIRTPPTQIEVHTSMINIESMQEKPNLKCIRKYYECAVLHHGHDSLDIWMEYIKFETEFGNVAAVPIVYRRAVGMLKKELVDEFIKLQTLAKIK